MAQPVGGLNVQMSLDQVKFAADIAKAQAQVNSMGAKMNTALGRMQRGWFNLKREVDGNVSSFFKLKNIAYTLAGTAGIGYLIKQSIDYASVLVDTSDKLGITTQALQEYRYMAKLSGVSTEAFETAYTKFSKSLANAQAGNASAVKIFKELGVEIADAQGNFKSSTTVFNSVGDAIDKMEPSAQRTRLQLELMGKTSAGMVNMFKGGSSAMEAMRTEANALGVVIDEKLLRNAEATGDKLEKLGFIIKAKVNAAVLEAAPAIGEMADNFIKAIPAITSLLTTLSELAGVLGDVYENSQRAGQAMYNNFHTMVDPLKTFQTEVANTDEQLKKLYDQRGKGTEQFQKNTEGMIKNLEAYKRTMEGVVKSTNKGAATTPTASSPVGAIGKTQKQLDAEAAAAAQRASNEAKRIGAVSVATEQRNKLEQEANSIKEKLQTSTERYNAEMAKYTQMLNAGLLTQEQFNRAQVAAQAEMDKTSNGMMVMDIGLDAIQQGLNSNASGWKAWGKIAVSALIEVIQKMVAARAAQNAMGGSRGGGLGGILGAATSLFSIFTGGGSFSSGAGINTFTGLPSSGSWASVMHSGGIVGGGSAKRNVSGRTFAGAQRYHSGGMVDGLKNGEVPIIAKKGERVMTEQQQRSAGSKGDIFNIDMRGASMETVEQLKQMLTSLNGSIERRAVAAIRTERGRNPKIFN